MWAWAVVRLRFDELVFTVSSQKCRVDSPGVDVAEAIYYFFDHNVLGFDDWGDGISFLGEAGSNESGGFFHVSLR
jgi:hypothetical protein